MSDRRADVPRIVFAGGFEGVGGHPDHRHEGAWELLYLRDGQIEEKSGTRTYSMGPSTFVVLPPGAVHGETAKGKYFLYHLLLVSGEPLAWPEFGQDLEGEPIGALIEMVVREWYNGHLKRDAFLRHSAFMLDILLRRCALRAEEADIALRVVTRARGVFRREFRKRILLRDIACEIGVSRSTLFAYFQQVLARTPQDVLDGIRLRHAVYLLRHSELSISEVAVESGYCSSSHLGRKLRSSLQMTAGDIRDSFQRNGPVRFPAAKHGRRR